MNTLYRLEKIRHSYANSVVLDIERLELPIGGITGFFGPNGSGKSTLFSLLSFIERPTSGKIFFKGIELDQLTLQHRRSIAILPQEPYLLRRSVFENVAYGLKIRGRLDGLRKRVEEALSWVGLPPSFLERRWYQLSGGEAQRVALASRLILRPEVLILDEPTASVDLDSAQRIREAILRARNEWQTTLLVSSHDHEWLGQICNHRVGIFKGKVVPWGVTNFLFGPWEETDKNHMVKHLPDGQRIVLPAPQDLDDRRDAVAQIEPSKIKLSKGTRQRSQDEGGLLGVVGAIRRLPHCPGKLEIEVNVAGHLFHVSLGIHEVKGRQLWPGTRVLIKFDPDGVVWL